MRAFARVATVVVTAALAVGGMTLPAYAASPVLVSSTPAAGSVIKTKPTGVSITFDQAVATTSTISVAGPAGSSPCTKATQSAAAATISCTFTGTPTATVNDGVYTVSYAGKSTGTDPDGTGSFTFTLDTVAPAAPTGLTVTPATYLDVSDTLTVTGTSESATDSVLVAITGGPAKTVTPAANRTFSAVFTSAETRAAADGTVTVTATSTDTAGNLGTAATKTFVKDTARPTVTASTPADGGATNAASLVYNVTASEALTQTAPASTVRLFDSTGTELAATVTYPTTTTIRATAAGTVPEGTYTARIFLTDTNGNTSQPSPTVRTFTIDRTAPAAPVITTPLATVNKANASAWPVAGTGEAGASLTVTAGSVTKTITVPAGGSWNTTVDLSGVADTANLAVSARQTDAGGNQSPVSATATTSKDTVSPAVTGQAVTPSLMGTSTTTATLSGSVNDGTAGPIPAPAAENAAVQVTADDTDPATSPVVANTTSPSGAFSVQLNTSTLSDGTITYRVVATDAAGNPSTAVTTTNTKDTVAPGAPTAAFSPATINNANKAAISVTGTATGTNVRIVLSDGTPAHDITQTATVTSGSYSSSFSTTTLTDGTVTATVTSTDAAGNTGAATTATATKDTVAPATPTNLVVPTYVNSGSMAVSGKADAGTTVRVNVTDSATPTAGTATATAVVAPDGTWSLSVNVSALAQGALAVSAISTDGAGNPSTAATGSSTKDTVAPDQPATVTATPSPYVPSSTTFTVAGTTSTNDRAATDLQAVIVVSDGATPPTTITATVPVTAGTGLTNPGTFTDAFTAGQVASLGDGMLTVSVTFKDPAGNVSAARTTTAVKDTTPIAVVSTSPADGALVSMPPSASVTFNEAITSTTATTPSTISVTNKNGVTLAGSAAVSGRTITFTPSSPFSEAGSPFTVAYKGVDAVLTTESKTGSFQFSVDNTPPAAPVVSSVTNPVNQANQTTVVVSGTAESPGLPVRVVLGGTVVGTTTSGAGGSYSVTLDATSLADGPLMVSVTAQDAAGNTSTAGTARTTKDTAVPTRTSATPVAGSTVQPPATIRIVFSEALAGGTISVPGVPGTSAIGGPDGTSVVFTPTSTIPDGTYTATATVTDLAGNPGSGASTFTVDGTGPAVSGLAATATTSLQQSTTVTGTTEAGAGVALTATDGTHTVSASVTAGSDGSFSKAVDLSGLDDGTVTVTARATDALGNTGGVASTTAPRDTHGPLVTGLAATATSSVQQTTTVTGSTEAGASVEVSVSDGTLTRSGTTTAGPGGAFLLQLDLTGLADGTLTVAATATDTVGNPGLQSTATTSRDTAGPAITGLDATATTSARQSTTVTGSTEAGASVAVSATDGTITVTGTATAGAGGGFTAMLDLTTLADGTVTATAQATDTVGNQGAPATTTTARDTTGPAITGLAATATSSQQQSTTVTGSTEPGAAVTVVATDGTRTSTDTTTVGAGGGFSVELDLTGFADGTVTVTARATDPAGNTGQQASTTTTRDATGPAVTGLAATTTTSATQSTTVTGSTEAGASVALVATDGTHTVTGTTTAGAGGGFTATLDLTGFADGTITVTARATDARDNRGQLVSTTTTRDATGPTVTGLAANDTTASRQTTTVTGSTEGGASVAITATDGTHTATGTATAATGGGFTAPLDLTALDDGTVTVTARATDGVGNQGLAATTTARRDTTAPTVSGLAATATTTPDPTSTVTGTRSETATVAVTATDGTTTVTGTVASGSGAFSVDLDLSTLEGGTITVTARATDTAGNLGPAATTTTTRTVTVPGSTTTLAPPPGEVVYGAAITLTGQVTRADSSEPYGLVNLVATDTAGTTYDLGAVQPDATGAFSKTLKPRVNARYQASYAGDADAQPSASVRQRTDVAAKVTGSSTTAKASTKAVVNGRVNPAVAGQTVRLYRFQDGSYVKVATTTVDASGGYTFRLSLPRGQSRLEVRVAATKDNAAGSVRITAKRT